MSIYSKLLATVGFFSMTAAILSIVPVSGVVVNLTSSTKIITSDLPPGPEGANYKTISSFVPQPVKNDKEILGAKFVVDSDGNPISGNDVLNPTPDFASSSSSSISKTIVSNDTLNTDGPEGNLGLKKDKEVLAVKGPDGVTQSYNDTKSAKGPLTRTGGAN